RRFQRSFLIARQQNPRAIRAIRLTSATVEFAFAPEERNVYSYERTPKDLAPLGAKPGGGTFARAGKSDCAPTELRTKERTARLYISPFWGEATDRIRNDGECS